MSIINRSDFDANMDPECINLCLALNHIEGVETTESCCGHGTAYMESTEMAINILEHLLHPAFTKTFGVRPINVESVNDLLLTLREV